MQPESQTDKACEKTRAMWESIALSLQAAAENLAKDCATVQEAKIAMALAEMADCAWWQSTGEVAETRNLKDIIQ